MTPSPIKARMLPVPLGLLWAWVSHCQPHAAPGSCGAVSPRLSHRTLCPKTLGLAGGPQLPLPGKLSSHQRLFHELNRLKQSGLAAVQTPCVPEPGSLDSPSVRRLVSGPLPFPGLAYPSRPARPVGKALTAGLGLALQPNVWLPHLTPPVTHFTDADTEVQGTQSLRHKVSSLGNCTFRNLSPPLSRHILPVSCLS